MPRERVPAPVRGASLVGLLLVGLLLSGCLGDPTSPIDVVPYLDQVSGAPARTLQVALFLRSTDTFRQDWGVAVEGLPARWTFEPSPREVGIDGDATSFLLVNVTPSSEAQPGDQPLRVKVGDSGADIVVHVGEAGEERVVAGALVEIEFVVWAANGSVVASNAPRILNGTGLPNATYDPTAFGIPNATHPARAFVPTGDPAQDASLVAAGHASLPAAWAAALLRGPDGSGARAGDTLSVRWTPSPAVGDLGALLRVLGVASAPPGADPTA